MFGVGSKLRTLSPPKNRTEAWVFLFLYHAWGGGGGGGGGGAGRWSKLVSYCVLCVQFMLIKVSSPLNKFVHVKMFGAVYSTRLSSISTACKRVCAWRMSTCVCVFVCGCVGVRIECVWITCVCVYVCVCVEGGKETRDESNQIASLLYESWSTYSLVPRLLPSFGRIPYILGTRLVKLQNQVLPWPCSAVVASLYICFSSSILWILLCASASLGRACFPWGRLPLPYFSKLCLYRYKRVVVVRSL